ncbi:hypothetical protein PENANT_c008G01793 [Penicillium antarcticum]|uniref:Fcf2 pre-rRNA processing C-terminal domain-containing protein n=1 Tax=Penicillium antarcticum TaxID=416450 RepID=A0A1V6QB27_9EURO|nr:uncharacterized protein N7508_006918 [Penicillium antarcticum]KAJ5302055.1 hypothetical protein N7508_006918 [Penicillium antarcticum]OQD86197.1 hypothetical protein PENANT_c008G01793 [Penicillium antarcticum]
MASSTDVQDVDLTDDQVQQLLLEAEARLRGPAVSASVDVAALRIPKLSAGSSFEPYVQQGDDVATVEKAKIADPKQMALSNTLHTVGTKKANKDKPTAGPEWFNLPKTEMTPELKRDLQLIRMRSVLDAKRHYKKDNGRATAPEFSQVGTIIQGPTEFFSSRIAKKDRKKNFVEETLADERGNRRFKSKYSDIQTAKTSGKKAFYKDLQAKRSRKNK